MANHRAEFLQNFDLIFVQATELTLRVNSLVEKNSTTASPSCAVAFFPDNQPQLASRLLDTGFDRCLSDSFDEKHLAALVRALLRRSLGMCSTVSFYGDLEFNHTTKQSLLNSKSLDLPLREALILGLLLRKVGKIVPTQEFVSEIDPLSNGINKSTIHLHIHKLRNRISSNILPIRNIKRNGYFLNKYTQHVSSKEVNTVFGNLYG
jgi:DNA-binding winged helix-turn-helix (wHTH) protein